MVEILLVHRNKETEIGGAKKKERSNEDGFLNESATATVPVASTREAVRDKSQLSRKEKRDKKEGHQLGVKSGIDDSTGAGMATTGNSNAGSSTKGGGRGVGRDRDRDRGDRGDRERRDHAVGAAGSGNRRDGAGGNDIVAGSVEESVKSSKPKVTLMQRSKSFEGVSKESGAI